jgi:hypothetical protein
MTNLFSIFEINSGSMTRDAKLYFVTDKDWRPLKELALAHLSGIIQHDIAIFQVASDTHHHYAVISVSDEADAVIEQYGGSLGSKRDLLIPILKEGNRYPLFGETGLTAFLN